MRKHLVKKQFEMITLAGEVLFSDLFLSRHLGESRTILANKLNQEPKQFAFPLGYSALPNDILSIFENRKESITTYGVLFSKDKFGVFTLQRYPLIARGRVTGIINNIDFGFHQLLANPCFQNIRAINYKYEKFTKNEIKLLFLLAQFPKIKNTEIKKIFDVQIRTTYIYKHDLINKLKYITHSDKIDYTQIVADMFQVDLASINQTIIDKRKFIVLPQEEFFHHLNLISRQNNTASVKYVNNFSQETIQKWQKLICSSNLNG
ncbi:hypothetical protein L3V83_02355 [Thiotrichales bacterium 19X7-9]|nr:hypothetical protein [Thiotrichales bacterium 19X7-9]